MNAPVPSNIGDGELSVGNILRHGARWHANRTATTVGAESSPVRYDELEGRAGALANGLVALGVGPGTIVGAWLWNTREHLEAYFGVPSMGAVLHTINPRLSPDQLVYTINHAADEVLLIDGSFIEQLAGIAGRLISVRTVVVIGGPQVAEAILVSAGLAVLHYENLMNGQRTDFAWPQVDERSAATLCYTTGTTGDPKGVAYSHRSIWLHAQSLCTANAVGVNSNDTGYIIVPMFHANAWGYPFATVLAGGDLLLCGRQVDPATVVGAIEKYQPTFSNGVPTVWNDILAYVDADPSRSFGRINRVILGGAPIPESLRAGLARHGVEALQGWGMTETSPLITMNRPPRPEEDVDPVTRRGKQGRILAGVELRVVEPDSGEILPTDGESVGELELRGPWIANSYFHADADADDKFRDGWLRTGDVGMVDALGYVQLTDRAKDVIKSGGEWISSVQLELEIARHPAVRQAAVVGVPDEQWDERPCALVVLHEGAETGVEQLSDHLFGSVPKWWVPERWVLIDSIPLTSVGKFDKRAIRERLAAGDWEVVRRSGRG